MTAGEVFGLHPEVKKILQGGKFWTDGYFYRHDRQVWQ